MKYLTSTTGKPSDLFQGRLVERGQAASEPRRGTLRQAVPSCFQFREQEQLCGTELG